MAKSIEPFAGKPTMADELRLLCDEMLASLGRWLRLAGYDYGNCRARRRHRRLRNELRRRLSLDSTFDPLSRCTLCNARLELADHRLLESLPPRLRALGPTVRVCPHCGRLYWEGSHVHRMRRRLAGFAQQGEVGRVD